MATASPQHHHVHNRFPPSPPPSPPAVKKRHRKKDSNDPFLQLGDPANHRVNDLKPFSTPGDTQGSEDPLYKRVIVTPFLFVSFLISLFLVDTQNAINRTRNSTFFNLFDPAPYQDPSDSTWGRRDSSMHVEPPDALNPDQRQGRDKRKRKSWHLHKKIRKIARLEISDAFEMRRRVMVAMALVIMLAGCAVWCFFAWVLRFW